MAALMAWKLTVNKAISTAVDPPIATIHHAIEDANLFVELGSRDAELAPVIERLSEEHEVVAAVLTRLDAALVDAVRLLVQQPALGAEKAA